MDGSHQIHEHRASLNVTTHIYNELDSINLLLHLGGLSYAKGYSSVVSGTLPLLTGFEISLFSGTPSLMSLSQ